MPVLSLLLAVMMTDSGSFKNFVNQSIILLEMVLDEAASSSSCTRGRLASSSS